MIKCQCKLKKKISNYYNSVLIFYEIGVLAQIKQQYYQISVNFLFVLIYLQVKKCTFV